MKYIVGAVIVAILLINVLALYCAMRVGAEEDRWIEEHQFLNKPKAQEDMHE